jgi:hypothetical protein
VAGGGRVGGRGSAVGLDALLEGRLRRSVVRRVVGDAVPLDRSGAAAQCDVHPFGLGALDLGQLFHVRADLQQGRSLDVAGQLGVDDLIAPGAQSARPLDSHHEIGQPEPPPVEEGGLVNHVVAAPDRLPRGLRGRPQPRQTVRGRNVAIGCLDARDLPPAALELRQIAGLVLETALRDQVYLRVESHRPIDQPGHGRQLEPDQMLARQEPDQIGCREDRLAIDELHRRPR